MNASRPNKDLAIETLRGIAILLLVLFHATTTLRDHAEADLGWFGLLNDNLAYVRMPLFTVISGYVYAIRPVSQQNVRRFSIGKARRLLLPLGFVAGGFALMRGVEWTELWKIWVLPYEHFWFLQAIALVFAVVVALELGGVLRRPIGWAASLIAAGGLQIAFVAVAEANPAIGEASRTFSVQGAIYLLPYFLLGLGLFRFSAAAEHPWLSALALLLVIVGYAAAGAAGKASGGIAPSRLSLVALCVGLGACFLLVRWRRPWAPLARLGRYAYPIYLFHAFGLAFIPALVTRSALPWPLILVLATVGSLAIGVAGHHIFVRWLPTRRAFLGAR